MKTRLIFFKIILISLFFISNIQSQTNNPTVWNEESLKKYIEKNVSRSNQNDAGIHYLLIDPEQSFDEQSKGSLQMTFKSIQKEFNINNILILTKSIENSFDNKKIEELINSIKTKLNFNTENLITTLISTSNPKTLILRGNNIKEKISDNEITNLIQNLEKSTKTVNKSELSKSIIDHYENILNILRTNNQKSKNFFLRYKGIIVFIILILIIIICIKYFSGESNDLLSIISQKETKIISFLDKNKPLSIKEVTNNACIICLENYNKIERRSSSQNTSNTSVNITKERKSSNASDSTENVVDISDKIHLPCKHVFHESCLMKWKIYESKCPLCGAAIVFNSTYKNKIDKFYQNKNWVFNETSKFRLVIEDFMRIQKTFYPHMIHSSFAKKVIDTYKIKFEKEPVVICVSPETLICKTLPSEDRNVSKYDQLEYSTQTSTDEKRIGKKEIIKDI